MEASALNDACLLKEASSYTSTSLNEAVRLRGYHDDANSNSDVMVLPQTIPRFFRDKCTKFATKSALVYERITEVEIVTDKEKDKDKELMDAFTPIPTSSIVKEWITVTYNEYEQNVERAAIILQHVGLQPRTVLGIWMSYNSPEWNYSELGALRAGGIVAGIYPTSSTEAVHHILNTSSATVCVVQNADQMLRIRAIRDRLPHLVAVLQVNGPFDEYVGKEPGYHRWSDLWERPIENEEMEELMRREADIGANECAFLIYTSGTVALPKAVMITHDAVVNNANAVSDILPKMELGAERIVTFLPYSHIAAQIFDIFMAINSGVCVHFADADALKSSLVRTLKKARPTRMFGVPRIFEKFYEKLIAEEAKMKGCQKFLLKKSREALTRYHVDKIEKNKESYFTYWWASKIVDQIKVNLGLDQCRSFIVGGAPLNDDVNRFFLSLDMPLNNCYGMSESSGCISINIPLRDMISVGPVFNSVEVKIKEPNEAGQGEICIRSRMNMMGYLNDPIKTNETITEDGWLSTGDMGYIHENGSVVVCGRIKELIITSGGENVPPLYIENYVRREMPFLSYAMVVGDHQKYLNVLLTLKTEEDANGMPTDSLRPETIDWLRSLQLDFTCLSQVLNTPSSSDAKQLDEMVDTLEVQPHPDVIKAIEEGLKRANMNALSNAQRLQKFALLPHDFSTLTGELGPTLKIRRGNVLRKYAKTIDRLYE